MKWVFGLGVLSVLIYLALVLLVYIKQRDMLYFPPSNYMTPLDVGLPNMQVYDFSRHDTENNHSENKGFEGWYAKPSENKPVVMFFHGNGSAIYSNHDIYHDLIENGFGVWAVGYQGYPPSIGSPSQTGLIEAALEQHAALLETGIPKDRIILFGTSLGAGVAAQIAKDVEPAMIIMDAPFNSAVDMGKSLVPFLPVGRLMKDTYKSHAALEDLQIPMLWLHGTHDNIIPLSQGQKLYDGYSGPKSAHVIEGGQHTNLWFMGGREIILEALASQ